MIKILKKLLGIRPTFGKHTPIIPRRKVTVPLTDKVLDAKRRIIAAREVT